MSAKSGQLAAAQQLAVLAARGRCWPLSLRLTPLDHFLADLATKHNFARIGHTAGQWSDFPSGPTALR